MWKSEAERHNDAIIEAIDKASHRIATAITEGFIHMADVQAQALQDLSVAIANITNAITDEITALTAAIAAQGIDDSPAIESAVTNLNNLTASLKASVAPTVPAGTTSPVAPSISSPAPAAPASPTAVPPVTAIPDPTTGTVASVSVTSPT